MIKNPASNPVGLLTTFEVLSLYEDDKIFSGEFIFSGSEYPKGPYIGLPSYAHPIIGECDIMESNSPFGLVEKDDSRLLAMFWEYCKDDRDKVDILSPR